jgi:hypothetical protein
MKGLKLVIVLVGIVFFGVENTYGQVKKIAPVELDNNKLKNITLEKLPEKVKESVATLAGYQIKQAFYSEEKGKTKLYKVQIARGPIVYHLIVDSKGRILETQE